MFFPISKNKIYFDCARSGGMSNELLEWRKKHENLFLKNGSLFRENNEKFVEEVRNGISKFMGVKNNYTFLTSSFSLGFQTLLSFLAPQLKFLVLKDDYPSIINGLKVRNFNYEVLDQTFDLEDKILKIIEKGSVNVLVLSIVQYINGIYIDINFFKKLKKHYPHLLIIADGTQFCGTKHFNFDNSGIDVLISSGYKWVYGGYGNGFVLIDKGIDRYISKSVVKKSNYNFLKKVFEPGNLDTLCFGSLLFSLKFITNYGIDKIEKKINDLSLYAKAQFLKFNLLDDISKCRNSHSNIYSLNGNEELYLKLLNNGIVCSFRGERIRVSLAFFNTEKQIDELLKFF